jgi:hypothetical protein
MREASCGVTGNSRRVDIDRGTLELSWRREKLWVMSRFTRFSAALAQDFEVADEKFRGNDETPFMLGEDEEGDEEEEEEEEEDDEEEEEEGGEEVEEIEEVDAERGGIKSFLI